MSAMEPCGQLLSYDLGVCHLGSEAAHRPAKGTAYGTRTAKSVLVSRRPRFHEADRHRTSINSDVYCETLQRLHRSIKNKRPELLTEGVVLLHDNARPHVSRVTQMELDKFKWETLDHPPYSPDMSPCDFHVLDPLKKHLKGKHFNLDDVLKNMKDWVSSLAQEFWEQGILRLVHQWDHCAQAYGVYFESNLHLYPLCRFVPFHLITPYKLTLISLIIT
ncbi:histone-lysine N-methyltransferase SETMAR [Trichonephila clavipes]|nr:histone-lysine N-methyltransferase SETMAR [Trichonephila clavipes]